MKRSPIFAFLLVAASVSGLTFYLKNTVTSTDKLTSANLAVVKEPATKNPQAFFHSDVYKRVAQVRDDHLNQKVKHSLSDADLATQRFQGAMSKYGTDNVEAKRLLQEALGLDHYNAGALRVLAGIVLNDGGKDEARRLSADCIAVDPGNMECHATLISTYTRYGEFDDAYLVLSDCLLDTPDNIHCLGGMETYYLHAEQMSEAKRVLDQMIINDPDSVWTHLAQANYFEKSGDIQASETQYEIACTMGQPFACQRIRQIRNHG